MSQREKSAESIVEAVDRAAHPQVARKKLIAGQASITYGELMERMGRLTRLFQDLGLIPGARVVVSTKNDVEAVVLFLSLLRSGITAVMLDPETRPARFETIMKIAEPDAVFYDAGMGALRFGAAPPENAVAIHEAGTKSLFTKLLGRKKTAGAGASTYPDILDGLEPLGPPGEVDPDLDAYVLFTSGTTSQPKGVRISHRSLFAHIRTMSNQFGYGRDTRLLNILRLSHTDGLIHGPVTAFANAATCVRPLVFEIQKMAQLLDAVYTHRITHFVTVPTMLALIDRFGADYRDSFDTDDFKFIISSAAPLDRSLWERFERNFQTPVVNVYGLTETVVGGLFAGPSDRDRRIGTVGKPLDCQVKLVDEDGTPVKQGQAGELLMKGGNIFGGYLNDQAATDEVLRDGWFHTGDIFVEDRDGFFRIAGRKKTLIITGGINVHPEEVTEVLVSSPRVLEAVTLGIEDETWGERVVSAVALAGEGPVEEADLIAHCREHLEPEKVPSHIHILEALPRTGSGKVALSEVREQILALENRVQEQAGGDFGQWIVEISAKCFNVPVDILSLDSTSDDTPGWDSLAHLDFVTRLENAYEIRFTTVEVMQIEKLSHAVAAVSSKRVRADE